MRTKLSVAAIGAAIAIVAPTASAPAQVPAYYRICNPGFVPEPTNLDYCIADDDGDGGISRKKPKVTLKVTPKKDLVSPIGFKASGKLTKLKGVTKHRGCNGKVKITVKAGRKTVAKKSAKVKKSCKYATKLKVKDAKLKADSGKLKVGAAFGGNARLRPAKAKTRTVKYAK